MLTRSYRFEEILAGIEEEERLTDGVTWRELLLPINRMRVFLIIALQIGTYIILGSVQGAHANIRSRRSTHWQHITSLL